MYHVSYEVSREGSEDFALQLECALTYEKEWYEIEDKLFVRVFWMPLLSNCFVESEDSDYRSWGTNGDFTRLVIDRSRLLAQWLNVELQ